MTKKDALTAAITTLTAMDNMTETVETLKKMLEQISVKRVTSDETKAARKAETAAKRAQLVGTIAPILRDTFHKFEKDMTAKELYEAAKDALPSDFSVAKVQNILIREMASELDKIEHGRNAYTYRLK